MNSCAKTLIPLIILAISTVTGCAKEQVLRKDDTLAPAPVQAKATPPRPAPAPVASPAPGTPAPKVADTPLVEQNLPPRQQNGAGSAELQNRLEKIYFAMPRASPRPRVRRWAKTPHCCLATPR
jgi:hypothetical protein